MNRSNIKAHRHASVASAQIRWRIASDGRHVPQRRTITDARMHGERCGTNRRHADPRGRQCHGRNDRQSGGGGTRIRSRHQRRSGIVETHRCAAIGNAFRRCRGDHDDASGRRQKTYPTGCRLHRDLVAGNPRHAHDSPGVPGSRCILW